MKLTNQQIIQAVSGTSYTEEKDGKIIFHRFYPQLENYYRQVAPGFNDKLTATAGVTIRFTTDSEGLKLGLEAQYGSSRTYFCNDIMVNGEYLDSLRNFTDEDMTGDYTKKQFPLGFFEKTFNLGKGEKEVTVILSAMMSAHLVLLEIDDGASFIPKEERNKILVTGDSITQGYDSRFPRNRYGSRLADKLNLTERNLAIGGDIYRSEAAKYIKEDGVSLIIVAYGSNDWSGQKWETAKENCEKYYAYLTDTFPDVPVYVISPIWRSDWDRITDYGDFRKVERELESICDKYENLTFVRGFDFVPHDTSLYGDGTLHPNDEGFSYYSDALIKAVIK